MGRLLGAQVLDCYFVHPVTSLIHFVQQGCRSELRVEGQDPAMDLLQLAVYGEKVQVHHHMTPRCPVLFDYSLVEGVEQGLEKCYRW